MTITAAKISALEHVPEGQLHDSALQLFCNSFSVASVRLDYCLDLSVPQVSFEIYISGVRSGGGVINPQHPTITIGGSVSGFKAEVTLTADFEARQLAYNITVCLPIVGCTNYQGTLFSW
jgi:hypothetical protein